MMRDEMFLFEKKKKKKKYYHIIYFHQRTSFLYRMTRNHHLFSRPFRVFRGYAFAFVRVSKSYLFISLKSMLK
ncbi:hypothetical protein FACS1894102_3640 [Spirochaetia bacterium]|nr:hypothetical protein FACS1894102_3640 [Spirochaetia bacterium]